MATRVGGQSVLATLRQRLDRSTALSLLAGAIAAAVLSPMLWLLLRATEARDALGLFLSPGTLQVTANSALLVITVTGLSVVFAVPLAYLTTRTDVPLRRTVTVLLAMPLVVPSYIGAFAFTSAFGPRGLIQDVLGVSALPSIYGFGGTAVVLTLYTYPYVFITTRAALKTLDTSLVDAARTLQHDQWSAFKRVTWPQIRPAVAAGGLLVALYALSDFGTPAIMRFDVFTRVIYVQYNNFAGDQAALLSLQLVVITTVILAIESRVRGSGVESDHPGRQRSLVHLGRWRWPAVAGALVIPLLALLVPLGILALWLATDTGTSTLAFQPVYALNSVSVAFAAALAAALLALPLAYVAARRHSSWAAQLTERASYVGYAVPGVVLALALVYFGSRYGGAFYRQGLLYLPLLVFAYVVRFLPQAVGSTRTSFGQVSGSLEEAARTLGDPPARAFKRVTLPLVAPGLLGGAALVFLTTLKELPATLMLRPAGFDTLVTHIWSAQQSGYYGAAAVPALVLLGVSALSLLVLLRLEGYDVE